MSDKEQTEHFENDVGKLVERYRSEYEMSYAVVVGVLQMQIHSLCAEAEDIADDATETK